MYIFLTWVNNENEIEIVTLKNGHRVNVSVSLLHSIKISLNDIVATSDETFYATNDCLWFQNHWKWAIETFLQSPLGNIVYYDGQSARPVSSRHILPNGINRSPDNQ